MAFSVCAASAMATVAFSSPSSQKNGSFVGSPKTSFFGGRKLRVSKFTAPSGARSFSIIRAVANTVVDGSQELAELKRLLQELTLDAIVHESKDEIKNLLKESKKWAKPRDAETYRDLISIELDLETLESRIAKQEGIKQDLEKIDEKKKAITSTQDKILSNDNQLRTHQKDLDKLHTVIKDVMQEGKNLEEEKTNLENDITNLKDKYEDDPEELNVALSAEIAELHGKIRIL